MEGRAEQFEDRRYPRTPFGLSDEEYGRVINDLLAEPDISPVLAEAASAGLTKAAIEDRLRPENLIDNRLWDQVNEVSGGSAGELREAREAIRSMSASIRRVRSRFEILRRRSILGVGLGLASTVAAALSLQLGWSRFGVAAGATAAALFFLSGFLAVLPWLGDGLPPLRHDVRRVDTLQRQESDLVMAVSAAAQTVLGRTLRPLLTTALHDARAEAARHERRALEERNRPVVLLGTEAPALLTGTRTMMEVVETQAHKTVESLVNGQRTAAIGIAGPRGAGKTTLIGRFCETQLAAGHPATGTSVRRVLGVKTSVPVRYEPRDFVLHLYAHICREVLNALSRTVPYPSGYSHRTGVDDSGFNEIFERRISARWGPWAPRYLGGAVLVFVGLFGIAWAWLSMQWRLVASGIFAVLLGALLFAPRRPAQSRSAILQIGLNGLSAALVTIGMALIAWTLLSFEWALTIVSTVIMLVGVLSLLRRHIDMRASWGVNMSASDWESSSPYEVVLDTDYRWPRFSVSLAESRLRDLRRMTERRLHNLQWQQALTRSVQGALSVSLPLSIEARTGREVEFTERPQPHPELVSDLRAFLEEVREALGVKIVIGIDELDKIATDADALDFINDIKDIFQLDSCYFLVAVSESALHSFARRGLPVRDAFDTAFDQIVRLGHWTPSTSLGLITRRTVAFPWPVTFFCHAFSGGLPRDLIRLSRKVFEANQDLGGHVQIDRLFEQLVIDDVTTQTESAVAVARDRGDPESLDWLLALGPHLKPAGVMSRSFAITLEKAVDAIPRPASGPDRSGASEVCLAVYAYLYYAATLLRSFTVGRTLGEWEACQTATASVAHELALARQELAIHPRQSWSRTTAVRETSKLNPLTWDEVSGEAEETNARYGPSTSAEHNDHPAVS